MFNIALSICQGYGACYSVPVSSLVQACILSDSPAEHGRRYYVFNN